MAKVLIVDDSAVMRLNLRKIITEAGHDVVAEASNGKMAMSMYEMHKPDLVTMDISMPIVSGVEATGFIVSKYPEARIVMISALNQKKMVYDALKKGARHYIIKPIDKNKVITVINEVLSIESSPMQKYEQRQEEKARLKGHDKDHFSIENVEGIFRITLEQGFDLIDMDNLSTAMQGLMFVKPLRLQFDFGRMTAIDDDYLNRILVYGKKAIEGGGTYESIAANDTFRMKLKDKEDKYLR